MKANLKLRLPHEVVHAGGASSLGIFAKAEVFEHLLATKLLFAISSDGKIIAEFEADPPGGCSGGRGLHFSAAGQFPVRMNTDTLAKNIRASAVRMVALANASHIGGALLMADLLVVLYVEILRVCSPWLIRDTIWTIFREGEFIVNKLRLPIWVLREIRRSLFPRSQPPPRE